jgi:hypothetical protein
LTLLETQVPGDVVFSPDAATAYAVGRTARAYRRHEDGHLSLLPPPHGVLRGARVSEFVVMPEGRHV